MKKTRRISEEFPNASRTDGDIAVVCVGSNSKKEVEYFANTGYNLKEKTKDGGGDRLSLRLDTEEIDLIRAMKAQNRQVVAVLYSGSTVIIEEWRQYADTVIMIPIYRDIANRSL